MSAISRAFERIGAAASAARKHPLLRDPLAHFLTGGALLFALHALLTGGGITEDGPQRIQLSTATLVDYLRQREGLPNHADAARRLEQLPQPQLFQLIDSYVREEALAREAVALALDQQDPAIRQRHVQTMEFVARGVARTEVTLGPQELAAYFEAHKADYAREALISFSHIYFNSEQGASVARARAKQALRALGSGAAIASDWPGDRFLYQLSYVEETQREAAEHFGEAMAATIFSSKAKAGQWVGPLESPHGVHVVRIDERAPAAIPRLDQVREQVQRDAIEDAVRRRQKELLDRVVSKYEVDLEAPLARAVHAN